MSRDSRCNGPAVDLAEFHGGRHRPHTPPLRGGRFYGGLTEDEVASFLRVSRRTVTRGFQMTRNWLRARLDDAESA